MIHQLALVLFCFLLLLTAMQMLFLRQFLHTLHPDDPDAASSYSPKAAVVLCLRGADPFLANCIKALVQQDYPDYELHIVIDSMEDPAWPLVNQLVQDLAVPVKVRPLKAPQITCSLKCSSLIQALSDLTSDVEVVALVDSDTVPAPTWLQELVGPLADSRVGVTTGNRWYAPSGKQWGSIVRYLWNSTAIVSMYVCQTPWGGTLAFRTDLLRQANLLEVWSRTLCEDVPLHQVLRKQQLSVKFIPSLVMVNHEECDLPSFLRWASRQLLLTRLYHPVWSWMLGLSLITSATPFLAILLLIFNQLGPQWGLQFDSNAAATVLLGAGLAIFYLLGLITPLWLIDRAMRRLMFSIAQPLPPFSASVPLRIILSIPLSQVITVATMLSATFARYTQWRGITYQINTPFDLSMVEYHPYRPAKSLSSKDSL